MKIKMLCVFAMLAAVSSLYGEIAVKSGNKIAFLGDSITSLGSRNPSGYLNLVLHGLKANGIKVQAIRAGIGGQKSNNMLARVDKDIIKRKPDFMTLSCGVNDVWHGRRGVKLEEYKKNITAIVEKVQKANIKVVLMSATMIYENPDNNFNRALKSYNDFLRQLAKEKNCLFVDTNGEMQKKLAHFKKIYPGAKGHLLTIDGVHMNPAGDTVMAETVLKGFGMDEKELAKARASWQSIPHNFAGIKIKIEYFPTILKMASERKCSFFDVINQMLAKEFSKIR